MIGQRAPLDPTLRLGERIRALEERVAELERAAQRARAAATVTVDPTGWSVLTGSDLQSVLGEIDANL